MCYFEMGLNLLYEGRQLIVQKFEFEISTGARFCIKIGHVGFESILNILNPAK